MMSNEEAEYEWGIEAADQIKDALNKLGISYKKLSEELKAEGFEYTARQIEGKLYRGSLKAAHFFIFMSVINKKFNAEVNPHIIRKKAILGFCITPRSRREIQEMVGIKDREHFRSQILNPLVKKGELLMTIPDRPKSVLQRYKSVNIEKKTQHVPSMYPA